MMNDFISFVNANKKEAAEMNEKHTENKENLL
jgi:hypothetical protein